MAEDDREEVVTVMMMEDVMRKHTQEEELSSDLNHPSSYLHIFEIVFFK